MPVLFTIMSLYGCLGSLLSCCVVRFINYCVSLWSFYVSLGLFCVCSCNFQKRNINTGLVGPFVKPFKQNYRLWFWGKSNINVEVNKFNYEATTLNQIYNISLFQEMTFTIVTFFSLSCISSQTNRFHRACSVVIQANSYTKSRILSAQSKSVYQLQGSFSSVHV